MSHDTARLERQYATANSELATKLSRLVYLKTLQAHQSLLGHELDQKLISQTKKLPPDYALRNQWDEKSLQALKRFLILQTESVKSGTLLGVYLPLVRPVLLAVHRRASYTGSDLNVNRNLDRLFTEDSPVGMKTLLKSFQSTALSVESTAETYPLVKSKLKSLVEEDVLELLAAKARLAEMEKTLEEQQNEVISLVKLTDKRIAQLRKKLIMVQNLMKRISIYSELIPGLVMGSYSGNWADNEVLLDAIVQSNEISETFQVFLDFCGKNLERASVSELLAVDLRDL